MRYEAPETLKSAVTLLAKEKGQAFVLAGGTDLLVKMKGGFLEPDLVVDIKRIKGVFDIAKSATGFRIGAAVPGVQLGENAALVKAWPGVVEGANLIGSKQVQGRCTMIGNLCNGSPAADGVPALIAGNAKVVISGPKGKRTIPVEQVPVSPGRTSLKKGEIIEAILLPKRPANSSDAYLRFIPRTEMDIAVVSAARQSHARRQGHDQGCPRCAGRGCPDDHRRSRRRESPDRHEARCRGAGKARCRLLRRLQAH